MKSARVPASAKDLIHQGVDLLAKKGWTKYRLTGTGGECCAIGSLCRAMSPNKHGGIDYYALPPKARKKAMRLFAEACARMNYVALLAGYNGGISSLNDAKGSTQDDVVNIMCAAAVIKKPKKKDIEAALRKPIPPRFGPSIFKEMC